MKIPVYCLAALLAVLPVTSCNFFRKKERFPVSTTSEVQKDDKGNTYVYVTNNFGDNPVLGNSSDHRRQAEDRLP